MMKTKMRMICLAALAGAALLQPGMVLGDAREDAIKRDLAALQGRWEFTGDHDKGLVRDQLFFYGYRNRDEVGLNFALYALEVNGETFSFAGTPAGKTTIKLDPTQRPKAINVTDARGRTFLGIYELNGDSLEICASVTPRRPVEFDSKRQPGYVHVSYKRKQR